MSYSIIETAKENNLNPYLSLTYLFEQLTNIDIESDAIWDALLPWSNSILEEIRKTASDEHK